MSKKKILIVGLDPNKIQFGIERRLTPENVIAAGRATEDKLVALGHEVQSWLIPPDATVDPLVVLLKKERFDVILVAAGLRGLPQHTLLFENIMNVIHRQAPSGALCFNSHPTDAIDAILRQLEGA